MPEVIITAPQNNQDDITGVIYNPISPEWYNTVREMRQDPTFALARAILTAPIIKNSWRVEGEDEKAKDLLTKMLFPYRQKLLREAVLNCVDYGWSAWECIQTNYSNARGNFLKTKNLRNEITQVRAKRNGTPFGLVNHGPYREVKLSQSRSAFVSAGGDFENPYGFPIMKNGERVHRQYKALQYDVEQFSKKFATNQKIIKYPIGESMTPDGQKSNALIAREVLNKPNAEGVAFPKMGTTAMESLDHMRGGHASESEWDYDILESSSSGSDPYLPREKYWDALKMRSLLIPERVALEGQHGTKAESSAQADIAFLAIENYGDEIITGFNAETGFVGRIFEYNDIEWYPNRAQVVPLPLSDEEKAFLKEIFRTIVNNDPEAIRLFDIQELAKRAGVTAVSKNYEKIIKERSIRETKGQEDDAEIL